MDKFRGEIYKKIGIQIWLSGISLPIEFGKKNEKGELHGGGVKIVYQGGNH